MLADLYYGSTRACPETGVLEEFGRSPLQSETGVLAKRLGDRGGS